MDRAASTRAATRRAASASDAHAASAAPRVSRGLRIDQYERGQTGVWFYQVDIELRSVDPNREGRTASGFLDACVEEDVQCYAVRRRYNEFLQLYEKIKDELATLTLITGEQCVLPPFPQKEYLSASMLGLLWRTSSSSSVLLEERRAKFETLLCWIETHPVLRYSSSYMDFLGQPPQRSEGYVSLKEYSSQNWLSSLEKLTKEKHKRRLRTSSDCSSCSVLQQEQTRRTKKRRTDDASTPRSSLSEIQKPFKRQRRHHESKMPRTKSLAKLRKMKRTSSSLSEQVDTTSRPDAEESSLQIVEPAWTAHVESSPIHKKKKVV